MATFYLPHPALAACLQAAIIVGELKLLVGCFWRGTRSLEGAQLYNLSEDASEQRDLAPRRPPRRGHTQSTEWAQ